MSNEKPATPKLKGFAGLVGNLVNAAMQNEECKTFLIGIKTRVLLSNQEDKKWAALITVIREQVKVQGIQKDPEVSIKKLANQLKAWGYWEFPNLQAMLSAAQWGSGKWIRKMAGSTVKGASQIAIIGQILRFGRPPS